MLVGALNQEKAFVGTFSLIVKTDGSFAALVEVTVGCDVHLDPLGGHPLRLALQQADLVHQLLQHELHVLTREQCYYGYPISGLFTSNGMTESKY